MKCPYCNRETEERVCPKCHAEIPVPKPEPEKAKDTKRTKRENERSK